MGNYAIVADSNADLPRGYAQEKGIIEVDLSYTLDGKEYRCNDPSLSRQEFYAKMRTGSMPKTAAVNVDQALEAFRGLLEQGKDILCIAFSSGLSATYQSFRMAADELEDQFPERKIVVIDTLCASSGQSIIIARGVGYQRDGLSLEDSAARLKDDCPKIAHIITVNDLFHLHRGGRVSKTMAVVGSILNVKPMICVDEQGKLQPAGKVRGRKQALLALVDRMKEMYDPEKCDTFAISHGDCLEDAQFVANEIVNKIGVKNHTMVFIGPTVGAHSGPGTVALFFYAKHR